MKLRAASLAVVCFALAAIPAFADYNNGPPNGSTDAWTINFGYIVSNSFKCCKSGTLGPASYGDGTVSGFQFAVWEFPGDTLTSVDWSITSNENGGTVYGSATASTTDSFISSNQYGYNIDKITVSGLNVSLTDPSRNYWLNLQNASVASGDPVYWDENSGAGCTSDGCPSSASESAVGTIPSEAFTINESGTGTTPEPGNILLFGSGLLGFAGMLRRKLRPQLLIPFVRERHSGAGTAGPFLHLRRFGNTAAFQPRASSRARDNASTSPISIITECCDSVVEGGGLKSRGAVRSSSRFSASTRRL